MVTSAARFCGAYDVALLRLEGGGLRLVAHHGSIPVPVGLVPIVRGSVSGRTVLEGQAVHVPDVPTRAEEFPEGHALALEHGFRTILSVPLLREGAVLVRLQLNRPK